MKRKCEYEEEILKRPCTRQETLCGTKRHATDCLSEECLKRRRCADEMDDLRRKNVELEQAVTALLNKVSTLEYMLSMFQRNETIGKNRLIQAF